MIIKRQHYEDLVARANSKSPFTYTVNVPSIASSVSKVVSDYAEREKERRAARILDEKTRLTQFVADLAIIYPAIVTKRRAQGEVGQRITGGTSYRYEDVAKLAAHVRERNSKAEVESLGGEFGVK